MSEIKKQLYLISLLAFSYTYAHADWKSTFDGFLTSKDSVFGFFIGDGGTGNATGVATFVGAINRLAVAGLSVASTAAWAVAFALFILALIKYVRHSDGKEQVSGPHAMLASSIFLFSITPFLNGLSAHLGFTAHENGVLVSEIAKTCVGVVGQVCEAGQDTEELTKGIFMSLNSVCKLIGFMSVFIGLYQIGQLGQAGGNRASAIAIATYLICGALLYNLAELIVWIVEFAFPNAPIAEYITGEKSSGFKELLK